MANIAFLGTGLLGGACAEAAAKRGDKVTVWNRSVDKARDLARFGIVVAATPAEAVRVAPSEQTVSTTVGWMQQCSATGQFFGPPLVAWLASRVGDWHWTWAATGTASLLGLLLARGLRQVKHP